MEGQKIGFFKRIKKAIFNFEDYQKFAHEKTSKAIGYMFKFVLIMAVVITIATTYKTYKIASNTIEKFKNETPYFEIKDGILNMENNNSYQYIDKDNYFGIVIDPNIEKVEDVEYSEGIAFAKDLIFIKTATRNEVIKYNNLFNRDINKGDIESILTKENLIKVYLILTVILFISNIIAYSIVLFINIFVLSVIGMIINMLAKTKLKYGQVFNISVYGITLSAILLTIYTVLGTITGLTIKYFNLAYDIIAYIYVITAILMIKGNVIPNSQELFVDGKVKEKTQEIEEQPKEKKKKKKEKEEKPEEPEGSNA